MSKPVADRRIVDRLIPLCLYNPDDLDSFAAATIVWNNYKGKILCEPVFPNYKPKTDTLGREVIVIGRLYTSAEVIRMAERAITLIWITAKQEFPLNEVEHNVRTVHTSHGAAFTAWKYYNQNTDYPGIMAAMHRQDFGSFNAIINNKE